MAVMSKEECELSLLNDPTNESGGRNQHNTPISAYNCGGFALSIYNWVTPYIVTDNGYVNEEGLYTDDEREALMRYLYEMDWSDEEIEEEILLRDVDFLLHSYPFLEEVNLEDCDENETIIAYRLFIRWDEDTGDIEDTDFHFKVRYHGFWFEKMGSEQITLCDLDADKPWQYRDDYTIYTSRIVYFTTRRK